MAAVTAKARELGTGKRVLLYVLLCILAVTMILPLLWMLSTSIKQPGLPASSFFPGQPTGEHYVKLFNALPFGRFYFNSILVVLVVTFGQLFTSALAGYAFARLQFPGRDVIFFSYLATMMIPAAVTMVPQFLILTRMPVLLNALFNTTYFTSDVFLLGQWYAGKPLGIDSYFALIVPMLFSPFGTFLLRQFFLSIPKELDEAAMIDGCGRFGIFRNIIVPMSKPALATLGIFVFMGTFKDFMWPLIMTNNMDMKTLPVGLANFQNLYRMDWSLLMAGSVMMTIPMVIIFLICQKWFVSGIQLGAVKG